MCRKENITVQGGIENQKAVHLRATKLTGETEQKPTDIRSLDLPAKLTLQDRHARSSRQMAQGRPAVYVSIDFCLPSHTRHQLQMKYRSN